MGYFERIALIFHSPYSQFYIPDSMLLWGRLRFTTVWLWKWLWTLHWYLFQFQRLILADLPTKEKSDNAKKRLWNENFHSSNIQSARICCCRNIGDMYSLYWVYALCRNEGENFSILNFNQFKFICNFVFLSSSPWFRENRRACYGCKLYGKMPLFEKKRNNAFRKVNETTHYLSHIRIYCGISSACSSYSPMNLFPCFCI